MSSAVWSLERPIECTICDKKKKKKKKEKDQSFLGNGMLNKKPH